MAQLNALVFLSLTHILSSSAPLPLNDPAPKAPTSYLGQSLTFSVARQPSQSDLPKLSSSDTEPFSGQGARQLRLKGGSESQKSWRKAANRPVQGSLAHTARVADRWDVHIFYTMHRHNVAIFRHNTLGTAVELEEDSPGWISLIASPHHNVTKVAESGEVILNYEPHVPLVIDGLNHWDQDDGFIAPDLLEQLAKPEVAGNYPMVAEWLDVGNWMAFDDGTKPFVQIRNERSNATVALTQNGVVFLGGPAGPLQPRKPRGIICEAPENVRHVTLVEAQEYLASLQPVSTTVSKHAQVWNARDEEARLQP